MDKLRNALTLANTRRMGFDRETALAIGQRWMTNFDDLFRQDRADVVFERSFTDMTEVPTSMQERSMVLTAHYCGYTAQFIALCKHMQRPLTVIIGSHPQSFVDMLRATCAKSGVDVNAVRSGMKMLRQIDAALNEGRILIGMFDVPWFRGDGSGRISTSHPLGSGLIRGSDAMFELAKRMDLTTHLSLHVRRDDGFAIRFQDNVSQAQCYQVLNEEFMRSPFDAERLCELHMYYEQATPRPEAVFFSAKERHFALSVSNMKTYEVDLQSPAFAGVEGIEAVNVAKLAALERASGLNHDLLAVV